MNEIVIDANTDKLDEVIEFVDSHLEEYDCSMKTQMQIDIAVEEVFVNIAHYAYNTDIGKATIRVEISGDPIVIKITFLDNGTPYDPLAKEDPDVTLSAEDRKIGGLGIFMTKKSMDNIQYEYKNGQNILTIEKNL
ncbi:MAG: ATP-binding protein [Eubacterium sp.]|nr:ATP-binding protein [Eubacterium sp.]